ncbi:ABC transporter permease [Planotetraspora phitsanulokensis]|uniref:ABC transporter permease n=1 Tax=Planotetraspora phitsanulokensis TaxID=575192 RepID=A0A8J3UEN7_9ACTN|nr:ABC transporter permease [Planotetraspora phitsanulokensis]GII43487.1 ABC transporter permease [Planotetraspora phitsanulokensis]
MIPAPARLSAWDLVAVGLAGLRARRGRAVLSALGVAIGIASMVAVLGISAVSGAGLQEQLARVGTNVLTVGPGHSILGSEASLPLESVARVSHIPGVVGATAIGYVNGATARRTDLIDPAITNGVGVAAARLDLLATLKGTVRSGTFLNAATARYPAVVLGTYAADRFGIDRPGRQIFVAGRWMTVIGILDPLPLAPDLDAAALVGWPYAERELGFDGHPTTVYERSTDDRVTTIAKALAATANPEHPDQVQVSRPSDALTAELAARAAFNGLFLGLGAVALLVGGIGIANVMVISVLERRQEIGLRRSLGATRGQIRLQFVVEAVALSLCGGVTGTIVGLAASLLFAFAQGWPLALPAQVITLGVTAAVLVGVVSGLYPARRAAALTPTEALATR